MGTLKKILVAEDEQYNFELVRIIFNREGFEVLRATNGQEAIDLVESDNDIGLIMMDIKMPGMNGVDATIEIKRQHPDLPIVAVTAFATQEDRNVCINSGCDDFMSKPIDRIHLVNIVRKLMNI